MVTGISDSSIGAGGLPNLNDGLQTPEGTGAPIAAPKTEEPPAQPKAPEIKPQELKKLVAEMSAAGVHLRDLVDAEGNLPPDKMGEARKRLSEKLKEAPKDKPLAKARLYESAAKLDPDNKELRKEVAGFYRDWGQQEKSDPKLRKTLLASAKAHFESSLPSSVKDRKVASLAAELWAQRGSLDVDFNASPAFLESRLSFLAGEAAQQLKSQGDLSSLLHLQAKLHAVRPQPEAFSRLCLDIANQSSDPELRQFAFAQAQDALEKSGLLKNFNPDAIELYNSIPGVQKWPDKNYKIQFDAKSNPQAHALLEALKEQGVELSDLWRPDTAKPQDQIDAGDVFAYVGERFKTGLVQDALKIAGVKVPPGLEKKIQKDGFGKAMAEHHAGEAKQALQNKDKTKAWQNLNLALGFEPTELKHYDALANFYEKEKEPKAALQVLMGAMELAPKDQALSKRVGDLLTKTLQETVDQEASLRGRAQNPGLQQELKGLLQIHQQLAQSHPELANSDANLKAAAKTSLILAEGCTKKGDTKTAGEFHAKALAAYGAIVAKDPKGPAAAEAHFELAGVYDAMGDPAKAVAELKQAKSLTLVDTAEFNPTQALLDYQDKLTKRLGEAQAHRTKLEKDQPVDSDKLRAALTTEKKLHEALGENDAAKEITERLAKDNETSRIGALHDQVDALAEKSLLTQDSLGKIKPDKAYAAMKLGAVEPYLRLETKDGKTQVRFTEAFQNLDPAKKQAVLQHLARAGMRQDFENKSKAAAGLAEKSFFEGQVARLEGNLKLAKEKFVQAQGLAGEEPQLKSLKADAREMASVIEAKAQERRAEVMKELGQLLGPLLGPAFSGPKGIDLTQFEGLSFLEFKRIFSAAISNDGIAFNAVLLASYEKVFEKPENQAFLRLIYEEVDPSAEKKAFDFHSEDPSEALKKLTSDLVSVSAGRFVGHHFSSKEGRERLAKILGDPENYSKSARANILREIASHARNEKLSTINSTHLEGFIGAWNYANLDISDQDLQTATEYAKDIFKEADAYENRAEQAKEKYLKHPEQVSLLSGEIPGPDGKPRALTADDVRRVAGLVELSKTQVGYPSQAIRHLAQFWLLAADNSNWVNDNAMGNRENRAFILRGAETLMQQAQGIKSEAELLAFQKNLNAFMKGHLYPSGKSTWNEVKHFVSDHGFEEMFKEVTGSLKEPYEKLAKFNQENEALIDFKVPLEFKNLPLATEDPKLRGAVVNFIERLQDMQRSYVGGYKQFGYLQRGLSNVGNLVGAGGLADIERANEEIGKMIARLQQAKTPQDLKQELAHLQDQMKPLGSLDKAFRAADQDGAAQLMNLAQSTLEFFVISAATEGAGTATVLARAAASMARGTRGARAMGGVMDAAATFRSARTLKNAQKVWAATQEYRAVARSADAALEAALGETKAMGELRSLGEAGEFALGQANRRILQGAEGMAKGAASTTVSTAFSVASKGTQERHVTIESLLKQAAATGFAMGMTGALASAEAKSFQESVLKSAWQRYTGQGIKGALEFAKDSVGEIFEEVVDAYIAKRLDGDVNALTWDELDDIVRVCVAGGGAHHAIEMHWILKGFHSNTAEAKSVALQLQEKFEQGYKILPGNSPRSQNLVGPDGKVERAATPQELTLYLRHKRADSVKTKQEPKAGQLLEPESVADLDKIVTADSGTLRMTSEAKRADSAAARSDSPRVENRPKDGRIDVGQKPSDLGRPVEASSEIAGNNAVSSQESQGPNVTQETGHESPAAHQDVGKEDHGSDLAKAREGSPISAHASDKESQTPGREGKSEPSLPPSTPAAEPSGDLATDRNVAGMAAENDAVEEARPSQTAETDSTNTAPQVESQELASANYASSVEGQGGVEEKAPTTSATDNKVIRINFGRSGSTAMNLTATAAGAAILLGSTSAKAASSAFAPVVVSGDLDHPLNQGLMAAPPGVAQGQSSHSTEKSEAGATSEAEAQALQEAYPNIQALEANQSGHPAAAGAPNAIALLLGALGIYQRGRRTLSRLADQAKEKLRKTEKVLGKGDAQGDAKGQGQERQDRREAESAADEISPKLGFAIPLRKSPPPAVTRKGEAAGMLISGNRFMGEAFLVPKDGNIVPVSLNGEAHEARYNSQTQSYEHRKVGEDDWKPIGIGQAIEMVPGRNVVLVEFHGAVEGEDIVAAPDLMQQADYQIAVAGPKYHLENLLDQGVSVTELDAQNLSLLSSDDFESTKLTYDGGDNIRAQGGLMGGHHIAFAAVDPETGEIFGFAKRQNPQLGAKKSLRFEAERNPAAGGAYHWRIYRESTSGYQAGDFLEATEMGEFPANAVLIPIKFERMAGTIAVDKTKLSALGLSQNATQRMTSLHGFRATIGMAGFLNSQRYAKWARENPAAPRQDAKKSTSASSALTDRLRQISNAALQTLSGMGAQCVRLKIALNPRQYASRFNAWASTLAGEARTSLSARTSTQGHILRKLLELPKEAYAKKKLQEFLGKLKLDFAPETIQNAAQQLAKDPKFGPKVVDQRLRGTYLSIGPIFQRLGFTTLRAEWRKIVVEGILSGGINSDSLAKTLSALATVTRLAQGTEHSELLPKKLFLQWLATPDSLPDLMATVENLDAAWNSLSEEYRQMAIDDLLAGRMNPEQAQRLKAGEDPEKIFDVLRSGMASGLSGVIPANDNAENSATHSAEAQTKDLEAQALAARNEEPSRESWLPDSAVTLEDSGFLDEADVQLDEGSKPPPLPTQTREANPARLRSIADAKRAEALNALRRAAEIRGFKDLKDPMQILTYAESVNDPKARAAAPFIDKAQVLLLEADTLAAKAKELDEGIPVSDSDLLPDVDQMTPEQLRDLAAAKESQADSIIGDNARIVSLQLEAQELRDKAEALEVGQETPLSDEGPKPPLPAQSKDTKLAADLSDFVKREADKLEKYKDDILTANEGKSPTELRSIADAKRAEALNALRKAAQIRGLKNLKDPLEILTYAERVNDPKARDAAPFRDKAQVLLLEADTLVAKAKELELEEASPISDSDILPDIDQMTPDQLRDLAAAKESEADTILGDNARIVGLQLEAQELRDKADALEAEQEIPLSDGDFEVISTQSKDQKTSGVESQSPPPAKPSTEASVHSFAQENLPGVPRRGEVHRDKATADYGTAAGATHEGIGYKDKNEDAMVQGPNWALVLDGMGGAAAGDKASQVAADAISRYLQDHLPSDNPKETLRQALVAAGRAVNASPYGQQGGGAVGVMHLIVKNPDGSFSAIIAHVGDAGAVVVGRDGTIKYRSKDQSQVQVRADEAGIVRHPADETAELQMRIDPEANIVLGTLGAGYEAYPVVEEIPLEPGDRIAMFSDGVSDGMSTKEIARKLATGQSAAAIQDDIFNSTLERMATYSRIFGDEGVPGQRLQIQRPNGNTAFIDESGDVYDSPVGGMVVDHYKADNLTIHAYVHNPEGVSLDAPQQANTAQTQSLPRFSDATGPYPSPRRPDGKFSDVFGNVWATLDRALAWNILAKEIGGTDIPANLALYEDAYRRANNGKTLSAEDRAGFEKKFANCLLDKKGKVVRKLRPEEIRIGDGQASKSPLPPPRRPDGKYQDHHGGLWASPQRALAWNQLTESLGGKDIPITWEHYQAAYAQANGGKEAPASDRKGFEKTYADKVLTLEGKAEEAPIEIRDGDILREGPLPRFPISEEEEARAAQGPLPRFLSGEEESEQRIAKTRSEWHSALATLLPFEDAGAILDKVDQLVAGLLKKIERQGVTPETMRQAIANTEKVLEAFPSLKGESGRACRAKIRQLVDQALGNPLQQKGSLEAQATPAPTPAANFQAIESPSASSFDLFVFHSNQAARAMGAAALGVIQALPEPIQNAVAPVLKGVGLMGAALGTLALGMSEAWAATATSATQNSGLSGLGVMAAGILLGTVGAGLELRLKLVKGADGKLTATREWVETGAQKPSGDRASAPPSSRPAPMSERIRQTELEHAARSLLGRDVSEGDPTLKSLMEELEVIAEAVEIPPEQLHRIATEVHKLFPAPEDYHWRWSLLNRALDRGITDETAFQQFFLAPMAMEVTGILQGFQVPPKGPAYAAIRARMLRLALELDLNEMDVAQPEKWIAALESKNHPLTSSIRELREKLSGPSGKSQSEREMLDAVLGKILQLTVLTQENPGPFLKNLGGKIDALLNTLKGKVDAASNSVHNYFRNPANIALATANLIPVLLDSKLRGVPPAMAKPATLQDVQSRIQGLVERMNAIVEATEIREAMLENIPALQKFNSPQAKRLGAELDGAWKTISVYRIVFQAMQSSPTGSSVADFHPEQLSRELDEAEAAMKKMERWKGLHESNASAHLAIQDFVKPFMKDILRRRDASGQDLGSLLFPQVSILKASENIDIDSPIHNFSPEFFFENVELDGNQVVERALPLRVHVEVAPGQGPALRQQVLALLNGTRGKKSPFDPQGEMNWKASAIEGHPGLLNVVSMTGTDPDSRASFTLEITEYAEEAPELDMELAEDLPLAARGEMTSDAVDPFQPTGTETQAPASTAPGQLAATPQAEAPSNLLTKIARWFSDKSFEMLGGGIIMNVAISSGVEAARDHGWWMGAAFMLGASTMVTADHRARRALGAVVKGALDVAKEALAARGGTGPDALIDPFKDLPGLAPEARAPLVPSPLAQSDRISPLAQSAPAPTPAGDDDMDQELTAFLKGGKIPTLAKAPDANIEAIAGFNFRLHELRDNPDGKMEIGIPNPQDYFGELKKIAQMATDAGNLAGAQEISDKLDAALSYKQDSVEFEALMQEFSGILSDPFRYVLPPAAQSAATGPRTDMPMTMAPPTEGPTTQVQPMPVIPPAPALPREFMDNGSETQTRRGIVLSVVGGQATDLGDPFEMLKGQTDPLRSTVYVSAKGIDTASGSEDLFSLRIGPDGRYRITPSRGMIGKVQIFAPGSEQGKGIAVSGEALTETPGVIKIRVSLEGQNSYEMDFMTPERFPVDPNSRRRFSSRPPA